MANYKLRYHSSHPFYVQSKFLLDNSIFDIFKIGLYLWQITLLHLVYVNEILYEIEIFCFWFPLTPLVHVFLEN